MSEADIPLRAATLERTAASTDSGWSAAWLWQRAFSFPAMLGAFLIGRVFYEDRAFKVDPDLWWHIRIGALEHFRLPSLAHRGSIFLHRYRKSLDRVRMAGRCSDRSGRKSGRASRVGNPAFRSRDRGYADAIRLHDPALGQFESRLRDGRCALFAGVCFVQSAAANVWLSVPRSDADCAGAAFSKERSSARCGSFPPYFCCGSTRMDRGSSGWA